MLPKRSKVPQAQKPDFGKEALSLRVSMMRELSGLKASIDRFYRGKAVVATKRVTAVKHTKQKKTKSL